jgi:hypothetical protein
MSVWSVDGTMEHTTRCSYANEPDGGDEKPKAKKKTKKAEANV